VANQPVSTGLHVRHLSKTFAVNRVLADVALDVAPGEVHGLVGQNGSGKSTLIKILAGYHDPDPGGVIDFDSADLVTATRGGRIRFVHQDLGLVLELNAIDNLALHGGYARGLFGRVKWSEQEAFTRQMLNRFELDLDVESPLSEARPVERTIVALAAAMQSWDAEGGLLVLDEPTASLPADEVQRLLDLIRRLRHQGAAILYVSHRLDELVGLADRVTALRGGHIVGTIYGDDIDSERIARLMVGEHFAPHVRKSRAVEIRPVVIEARNIRARFVKDVSIVARQGEVVGIAGLAHSGPQELLYAIAGASDDAQGEIRLPGVATDWFDIRKLKAGDVQLVPADRAADGIIGDFTVVENISLSSLDRVSRAGRLDHREERKMVQSWRDQFAIEGGEREEAAATLSGGNQQKVVLARCLAHEPQVLVMCEPTAGVDIAARATIHSLIDKLALEGLTILVSSSDLDELLAISTRILVMSGGRIAELDMEHTNELSLLEAMEADWNYSQ
jgi:ABC-type sugar transport system ATPase subunit